MMPQSRRMTAEAVHRWRRGFEAVEDFQRQELQKLSPLDRLKHIAALMRMARQCRMKPTYAPEEIEQVRRRWAKLRAASQHHETSR